MRLVLAAMLLMSCKSDRMTNGEAESRATEILGVRSVCFGDEVGWSCFPVATADQFGRITHAPGPVVVCRDSTCRKLHGDHPTMEAR